MVKINHRWLVYNGIINNGAIIVAVLQNERATGKNRTRPPQQNFFRLVFLIPFL